MYILILNTALLNYWMSLLVTCPRVDDAISARLFGEGRIEGLEAAEAGALAGLVAQTLTTPVDCISYCACC